MNLSADEEDIRRYCNTHELSRPSIKWGRIVLVISGFEALLILCLSCLSLPTGSFILLSEAVHIAVILLFGRVILRLMVQIYQRYAPESMRRKCTCQPSCSEYALLALEKYRWPKALTLIIRRVTHTCPMPGYKIDYP